MSKNPQPSPKPKARPQVEVTASGPLPLPDGWQETTLVLSGRHYIFFYNPDNRQVHAPGYPHLPLHSIRLHDGKIINVDGVYHWSGVDRIFFGLCSGQLKPMQVCGIIRRLS